MLAQFSKEKKKKKKADSSCPTSPSYRIPCSQYFPTVPRENPLAPNFVKSTPRSLQSTHPHPRPGAHKIEKQSRSLLAVAGEEFREREGGDLHIFPSAYYPRGSCATRARAYILTTTRTEPLERDRAAAAAQIDRKCSRPRVPAHIWAERREARSSLWAMPPKAYFFFLASFYFGFFWFAAAAVERARRSSFFPWDCWIVRVGRDFAWRLENYKECRLGAEEDAINGE